VSVTQQLPDPDARDDDRVPAGDRASERRTTVVLALLFGAVALFTGIDLAMDLGHGVEPSHAIAEGLTVLAGLAGASWMIARLGAVSRHARTLGRRAEVLEADLARSRVALAASKEEAERWRAEVRHLASGLGDAIDRQLGRWGLSQAEQEVALLLLKGLSHKEIADVRGTGEATVRQQSASIYRKAGLQGRHDLAAFFLEDLLAPRGENRGDGAGSPRDKFVESARGTPDRR
jgi:DNA-binding CsgD family transcriptional regulator/outer membrane murein-binding lipoprotein Lpp